MNLRKDHSHASTSSNLNYDCELLDGLSCGSSRVAMRALQCGLAASFALPFFCDENVAVAHYVCLPLTLAVNTTFSDGCLGSDNDEGRSEV